ncbi:MAG: sigma-70 family RNA polymerase sigma factor [Roseiflexaceae bacterium]|nr:sigma-70 family RNA polymerase sigma factor [Roseiflexaceae bacterium]
MDEHQRIGDLFENSRTRLQAVAFRMLGSRSEADDAVQEAWLRLNRADTSAVENMGGWLTTVVARVCLDMLRARTSRREDSLDAQFSGAIMSDATETDPEHEALLADSVGLALLVVLDTLAPAERLAFVLHDVFAVPFDEIAPIVERSPEAARKLASRARQRVRGASAVAKADLGQQRTVVEAFLQAAREGNFAALLEVLDPDVVFRADQAAVALGGPGRLRGATAVAKQFSGSAQAARPALINGAIGAMVAPNGHVLLVLNLTITNGTIVAIDVVAEPARLRHFNVVVLDDPVSP